MADISDRPMTTLEVYQLVDSVCEQVNAMVDELTANVNKALEARQLELVRPTSVKRVKRDPTGNIEFLEEYAPVRP